MNRRSSLRLNSNTVEGIHTTEGVSGCPDAFIKFLVLEFVALVLHLYIFAR